MPKRKRDETKEERWARKLRKYEVKLQEKRLRSSQRIIYSSDEDDVQPQEHLDSGVADHVLCKDSAEALPIPTDEEGLPGNDEAPLFDASSSEGYDAEVLQVLEDDELDIVEYADDIHSDIAAKFQKILVHGLKKETREEVTKKYLFPKNVPFAKAPTLNPEIEAMLPETCRLRDERLLKKQNQIGRALSGLGKAMTSLLKKSPNIPDVARTLHDVGKLIADSHYAETDTRRSVIIPLIDKSLTDPFKNSKRDSFLFGEGLGDVVKNSRGIKKTSQLIQASTSSSNLNRKGPSIRPRQQWVGQTHPQYRAGGQRTFPQSRRRVVPFPPPVPPPPQLPLARRQPYPAAPSRRQAAPRQRAATDRPQK